MNQNHKGELVQPEVITLEQLQCKQYKVLVPIVENYQYFLGTENFRNAVLDIHDDSKSLPNKQPAFV